MKYDIETQKRFILDEKEIYALMIFIEKVSENRAIEWGISEENVDIVFKLYSEIAKIF